MRRSPYQAAAAVLTMFVTMLLVGAYFVATAASAVTLQYFEKKPQITVFFTDEATEGSIQALKKTVEATGKVASATYVSKQEALAIYREQNKSDPLLLEMVTADILPASLEITTQDPKNLKEIEPLLAQAPNVEEVVFQRDVVEALIVWANAIRVIGGGFAGLLVIDSILIIMTVIGMKIALKRQEVEILSLVGASPWYIRMPFILEGGFYGLIAAFIAWTLILSVILWFRPAILSFLGIVPAIGSILANPLDPPFLIAGASFFGGLLLVGFFLGAIGSLVAIGRYLRV